MSRTMDILIEAEDNASQVIEDFGDRATEVAEEAESSFLNLKTAILGLTAGSEMVARQQNRITEGLQRTAHFIGSTEERMRDMAVSIADVTRPVNEVVQGFDELQKRGVDNEAQMASLIDKYDRLGDSMGTSIPQAIQDASRMFAGFGGSIEDITHYADEFSHIMNTTEVNVRQMARTMGRRRREIQDLGLTMEDSMVVLKALGEEFQDARAQRYAFRDAINEADGSMQNFLDSLGLTIEEFEAYRDELGEVSGEMDTLADIHADNYTIMQRLVSIGDRLKTEFHELFQIGSTLTTIITTLGMALFFGEKGFLAIKGAVGKVIGFLTATALPAFGKLIVKIMTTKAGLLALPVAVAYALDRVTNEYDRLNNQLEQAESNLRHYQSTLDSVEQQIAEEEGIPLDLVMNKMQLEEDIEETKEEIRNIEAHMAEVDEGGIIGRAISRAMDSAKDAISALNFTDLIHGALDGLEDILFDEWEFEDIIADMEEEDITPSVGKVDESQIADILGDYQDQIEAYDLKVEALDMDDFEELEKRSENAQRAVGRLLDAGLSPASSQVQNVLSDFLELANHMEDGERKTEMLNNAFADMVNSGLRPSAEGYDELAEMVSNLNEEYGNIDDAVKRRKEIMGALDEEIQRIEDNAEALQREDESWDKAEAKKEAHQRAFRQLLEIYGVAGDEIDYVVGKIDEYRESEDELINTLTELRMEKQRNLAIEKKMGDHYEASPDIVRLAQNALQELSVAISEGTGDVEELREEWDWWMEVLKEHEVDDVEQNLERLFNRLEDMDTLEDLDLITAEEADQRRLNLINQILEEMATNERHVNEETGELTEEFIELRDESDRLEESLDDTGVEMTDLARRVKDLKENIEVLPDVGDALGWEDEEVIEQQLSDIDAIIREMVEEGEDVVTWETEDGETVKITLEEIFRLQGRLNEKAEEFSSIFDSIADSLVGEISHLEEILGFFDIDLGGKISSGLDMGADFLEQQMNDLGGTFANLSQHAGGLLATIITLMMESETFSDIMGIVNEIIQGLADALGMILHPFKDLFQILKTTLMPVLEAIGQILGGVLAPILQVLGGVLRGFGVVVTSVAILIGRVWNALLGILDMIFDMSDYFIDIEALQQARQDLIDGTYGMTEATEDATEALEELTNVPRGFKYDLRKFQASDPDSPPVDGDDGFRGGDGHDEFDFEPIEEGYEEHHDNLDERSGGLFDSILGLAGGYFIAKEGLAGDAWDTIVGIADVAWDGIKTIAGYAWDGIVTIADYAWSGITTIASTSWDLITGFGSNAWNAITGFGSSAWSSISGIGSSVWNSLGSAGLGVLGPAGILAGAGAWFFRDELTSLASSAWSTIESIGSSVFRGLSNIISGLGSAVKNVGSSIWDGIKSVGSSIWDNTLGRIFHDGGIVGGTGEQLILAEAGELVVPKDKTQELLRGETALGALDLKGEKDSSSLDRMRDALGSSMVADRDSSFKLPFFSEGGNYEELKRPKASLPFMDESVGLGALAGGIVGDKDRDRGVDREREKTRDKDKEKDDKTMISLLERIEEKLDNRGQTVNLENVTIESDNPEEIWRELKRIMKRENYVNEGTIVETGSRYN